MQKYWLLVFGCAMNYADAERLTRVLTELKISPAQNLAEADLVFLVSCSVRQKADDRIFGLLKNLTTWQKQKTGRKIFLTGCLVRPQNRQSLSQKFPQLTAVFPMTEVLTLPQILRSSQTPVLPPHYLQITPLRKNQFSALIPIATGCNNFCTYCIVPFARGREISRPQTAILAECRAALLSGAQELFLLGQNVNSYGSTAGDFATLLQAVCRLKGVQRVRFLSSHPRDFGPDLITVLQREPKIERHLHLPAQHGSNKILAAMCRGYTAETYCQKVQQLRQALPEISLTSDFIVGFPGETAADFQQLCEFYETVAFDFAYLACYSPRPGTPAAQLPQQVPEAVKRARYQKLNAILTKITARQLQKRRQQTLQVLVEKQTAQEASGRSSENFLVKFLTAKNLIGQIVPVLITETREFELKGKLALDLKM